MLFQLKYLYCELATLITKGAYPLNEAVNPFSPRTTCKTPRRSCKYRWRPLAARPSWETQGGDAARTHRRPVKAARFNERRVITSSSEQVSEEEEKEEEEGVGGGGRQQLTRDQQASRQSDGGHRSRISEATRQNWSCWDLCFGIITSAGESVGMCWAYYGMCFDSCCLECQIEWFKIAKEKCKCF